MRKIKLIRPRARATGDVPRRRIAAAVVLGWNDKHDRTGCVRGAYRRPDAANHRD